MPAYASPSDRFERSIACATAVAERFSAASASTARRSTSTEGRWLTASLMRQTVSTPPRGPLTSSKRTMARSMCVANRPSLRPRSARARGSKPAGKWTPLTRILSGVSVTRVRPARTFCEREVFRANPPWR